MDEVVKTKFDNVDAEFNRVSHRLTAVEDSIKSFRQIAVSVEKMAVTMQGMMEELKTQGIRLTAIESKPAQKWESVASQVIGLIVAAVVGFALSKLF